MIVGGRGGAAGGVPGAGVDDIVEAPVTASALGFAEGAGDVDNDCSSLFFSDGGGGDDGAIVVG